MRNTWWVTRPKRSLVSVPLCLAAIANVAAGKNWSGNKQDIEQAFERQLEITQLKRVGDRRDRGGGGARTYRAWFKSLGLLFFREDGTLHLTSAGEALAQGKPPHSILTKQVLEYQYPSAFSFAGASAVDPRFRVRPFILLLQLLRDKRLAGFLSEKDEIAKLVITYGETNAQQSVDDIVTRILAYRQQGDTSLGPDFVTKFKSSRSGEESFEKLEKNLRDIANTLANWLGYTQLITRTSGIWELAEGVEAEVDEILETYKQKPLITRWDEEEVFQRRYGLLPGQRKDTRNLNEAEPVTSQTIMEGSIKLAYMTLLSTKIIEEITSDVIDQVSYITGYPQGDVQQVLDAAFPGTSVGLFMNNYAQMAFESRSKAREFEQATAEIFSHVFGFEAKHIGDAGPYPDIIISSDEAQYSAILDSKAYKDGYSIGISHQNRMRDYVEQFKSYSDSPYPLAFYSYVVSEHKATVEAQLDAINQVTGVPGSVISARNIIRLVSKFEENPISHQALKELFSRNKVIDIPAIDWAINNGSLAVDYIPKDPQKSDT